MSLDAGAVGLVRRKAVEGDETPRHVVGPFVRQKIADEVAAALGNDSSPVARVLGERLTLKRIDLIANHTRHHCPVLSCRAGGRGSRSGAVCRLSDNDDSFTIKS